MLPYSLATRATQFSDVLKYSKIFLLTKRVRFIILNIPVILTGFSNVPNVLVILYKVFQYFLVFLNVSVVLYRFLQCSQMFLNVPFIFCGVLKDSQVCLNVPFTLGKILQYSSVLQKVSIVLYSVL
jgi:hypothetical protein